MKGSLYTVLYAAGLGVVCALLLTAAGHFTEPMREANALAEKRRSILGVLEVPFDAGATAAQIIDVFDKNVRDKQQGDMDLYVYVEAGEGGKVKATAVPFAGSGLWGPIKGFLALEPDMETIRGLTFYQQEETPGLGGEIAALCTCAPGGDSKGCAAWFRHQFTGKKIVDAAGKPGIRILRRGAKAQNEIDGLSGATMTCDKVQDMLNAAIKGFVKERGKDAR